MKQKLILYKNLVAAFCKKSWRINKPLCVLVVLLVVIAGFFLWSPLENRTQKAAQQLMKTAENIRRFYQAKPNYWGLNTQFALENGILTPFRVVQNLPYNDLGRQVFVGYGPLGDTIVPGVSGFDIAFADLSYSQCVKLLAFPFSQSQNLGLMQISLYDVSNNLITDFAWGSGNPLPVSEQNARNYCAKYNNLLWHFE